jgi:hypothetical protein
MPVVPSRQLAVRRESRMASGDSLMALAELWCSEHYLNRAE